jgi:hypothetical protein
MNISFDGSKVTLKSDSRFLILADVAALEGLRDLSKANPQLAELSRNKLTALLSSARSGFTVFVHDLGAVPSRQIEFAYSDLQAVDDDDPDSATVDTGSLVVLDASKLGLVSTILTWEAYDLALQVADSSRFDALTAKIGGPYYAILHGDADATHCFHGDGSYRIRKGKNA